MKNGTIPNPDVVHPIAGYDNEIYIKPTINNPNIIVGDFTYIACELHATPRPFFLAAPTQGLPFSLIPEQF